MQSRRHFSLRYTLPLALLALSLGSCMKGESYNLTRIGISLPQRVGSWEVALNRYATTEATALGQPYFLANAQNDTLQVEQLADMLASDPKREIVPCRAVVLAPAPGATATTFDTLLSAETSVVLFNSEIELVGASYINYDNTEAGNNAAGFVASELGSTPAGKILVIKLPGESQALRREAFQALFPAESVLEESIDVPTYAAAYDTLVRMDSLQQLEGIEGIYAPDDDVALGVSDFVLLNNISQIKVIVGCGGSQDFLNYMIANTTPLALATTSYSPESITSAVALATAGKLSKGEQITLPCPLIDKSNAQEYINAQSIY